MKSLANIKTTLDGLKNFAYETGFDGGRGIFTKGANRGITIIWSYGGGWEHVSINRPDRKPTWDEMCELKDLFWNDDECVVQYHPPKSEYVNNLEKCLHLWKPIEQINGRFPMPPSIMVGLKGVKLK